ncbi:MAG: hypothetical protein E7004_01130 [Alphaproteobacteria bacterium]|nr:hypothetical protein [Alphaproteobacteria bacterium]
MTEEQLTEEKEEQVSELVKNVFLLKERFEIDFQKPLPELNTNGAEAFEVNDNISPQRSLFALICSNETAPRLSYIAYLKSIDSPNILKLVEYGIVKKESGEEFMALVYNKPSGPRADEFEKNFDGLSPSKFESLALSLLSACDVLKTFGLTHRAIRTSNLFYKDSTRKELVLGDCLASFPSFHQPIHYETIENMLCEPQSRGNGTLENDLYACGVALLEIALNRKISSEASNVEQLKQKLKNTSFSYLVSGEKIHSQISVVLRSLLDDLPENRCTYVQLHNFFEAKTTVLTSSESIEKANRSLIINGEKCYTQKSVAVTMLLNPDFGIEVIQSGKLLEWIKVGLENEKLYNKAEKLISAEKENNKTNLLYKTCILLDYSLPLKTTDGFLFPNGLAKSIFYCKRKSIPLTDIQKLINSDIIKLWYQEQPYQRAPSNAGEFKSYMARNDLGYGFDRIMYDFDEDLPCISPILGKSFVNSLSRLLKSLNNYQGDYQNLPFDKNIVAYLRCKMGKKIDGIITDLNANQDVLKISAILRLYATIQNKHGPAQLSNLTQWLVIISKPIIHSFHNIKYQKYLEQELIKVSKAGKIIDIVEILENEEARNKDRSDFSEALKLTNFLLNEKSKILSGDSKIEEEARDLAFRFSSILAVLTMLSAFVFTIIYWTVS